MKSSYLIALGLLLALVLWIASGHLERSEPATASPAAVAPASAPMKVRVADYRAETITRSVRVQGQLEPWRSVNLRAETAGTVETLAVRQGDRVQRGDLLVRIAMEDREIRLARAEAQLAQSRADLEATQRLFDKQLTSDNSLKAAQAGLAVAQAEIAAIRLDIERTSLRAPFDGVVEEIPVELGTLLERGDKVLRIVDDTRLKATAQVPQQHVANLNGGQPAAVELITGTQLEGRLIYIARVADTATRSFRVEVELANPAAALSSGFSAVLDFPVGEIEAHFVSPALLVLHDDGRLGVMQVTGQGQAAFRPVELVRSEKGGAWISGLPPQVRLITFGQGFISDGEAVTPVLAAEG